jgi:thiamine kinase-like enzyme
VPATDRRDRSTGAKGCQGNRGTYTSVAVAEATLEKFSADFLTERLRANGVLPRGRVIAVEANERRTTLVSTIAVLRVEYSADAPAEAPTRLFLKATRGGLDPDLRSVGEREVAFYRHAAPLMPRGPLSRCYDAEFIDGTFHLLLEDLSETHAIITGWPLPPSDEACERIIDTWAIFHAFWWRHPRLGRDVGTFLDESALAKITAEYRERYARFADTLDDRLWPAARAIYARVQDARDRLITPVRLYATYTIGHGDAHVWNLLYPRDGVAADGIRLIDWDNWRIGRAAADLAYMIAVHWYPQRRARLEARLLERYYAGLCSHGVVDYSLERLWEDYRLAVIGHLAIPVWQQTLGFPAAIWSSHLHRIVTAFQDLDCATLLA